jgi:hypothetical protein
LVSGGNLLIANEKPNLFSGEKRKRAWGWIHNGRGETIRDNVIFGFGGKVFV